MKKKKKNYTFNKKNKKIYNIKEAIQLLKNKKSAKFIESIDAAFNLNIDPKKSEQNVRGSVLLPHGTGNTIKIAVFTTGKNIKIAQLAGADYVGLEDLANLITNQKKKIDLVIASPETMHIVGKLGPILGPKGIMPNPKFGTITKDIKKAIQEAKKGKINYRNDKNGIIHSNFGKINFSEKELYENFLTLYQDIKKSQPNQFKGIYYKKINISTTMGPGIIIDHLSL
ncbi:50S ribosomal protein L1 [Buchnera aphidicola BCc]|uniref:Large ribosomal subunit protein uL1 n=2 Tax=Buchnera aphidicola TaxID=9 RepID=RL1_BUCCC|nr:50S ribosomal protein L1 [Buchnera aphidicola]Q058E2.1 RecName: Full=Large ribosomal subunit protein uL1; AltName: Full=50S ribosomal protein L1 [Buchnera aphidicola BCc]ABJ90507.1 50S ribosomal protein L1 [Buchnera aphidicola BCc]